MSLEPDLSLEAMRRLCRKAGAGRVSKLAAKELANILEEVGAEIAKDAIEFTLCAGRRTVKAKDIKAAYKKTFKSKSHAIKIYKL